MDVLAITGASSLGVVGAGGACRCGDLLVSGASAEVPGECVGELVVGGVGVVAEGGEGAQDLPGEAEPALEGVVVPELLLDGVEGVVLGESVKGLDRAACGASVGFAGRGEMVPNADCYCEIDPNTVDKYGIPVLRFHWKWTDHEYNQVKHMQETFRAIIAEMGGQVDSPMPTKDQGYGIANGGSIIHELGGARMGKDPTTSVVNANCQAHDVKNLFIADGAPFVSQADKNPTWTILALSMRTSDYIAQQRKAGAL
jgi:choline dehydrogenase-like flavoprotein